MRPTGAINIIGAGPTGTLLAILLRRRGFDDIHLYEARRDPRATAAASGRSINLALADRGIHALRQAGVFDELGTSLLPMRGREIHSLNGAPLFQPYGQMPNEINYSISRHRLNQSLIDIAGNRGGIHFHFEHRLEEIDADAGHAHVCALATGERSVVPMRPLLATDGAVSTLRRRLAAAGRISASEIDLEHGYKELSVPPLADGGYALRGDALHIWPRGNFMLIALPNEDGSFTATLFLPKHGAQSFDTLQDRAALDAFLQRYFSDVVPLMPGRLAEFESHPLGFLGTVSAEPWHWGQATLLGDAAHAMVPFHGQGMNCCFEDCLLFDALLDRHDSWDRLFAEFGARRKPDTDAISQMALENYLEMREHVADPTFQLQQSLALALERRFPGRFIPRYSMVMHHHEIPDAVALARGRVQSSILAELTTGPNASVDGVDFEHAKRLIEARLDPLKPVPVS